MFYKEEKTNDSGRLITVGGLDDYSLSDTFECGQCFRFELVRRDGEYEEYLTVIKDRLVRVGQRKRGELLFYDFTEKDFLEILVPYFSLDTDYTEIRNDILKNTDSEWLKRAVHASVGLRILRQDKWETLFSFIISQNNNIPRIKKIIKNISSEYGVNLCLQNGVNRCPLSKIDGHPCEEKCKKCGVCYSFPTAEKVSADPTKLLTSNPGFRYKYLCDAANKVSSGEINLEKIAAARSYDYTVERLKEIKGVGDKVASCVALFAFSNFDAFPIDVWMKRAIDTYFDGKLDHRTLGRYAGVAQQYIFHYIRNIENK